jgi:hypothetical protein
VTGNTITGINDAEVDRNGPYGIQILRGATGTVTDNQIANHFNAPSGQMACGIVIDPGAMSILVADNHFPDPGNEVDICDRRVARAVATPIPGSTPVPTTVDAVA